MPRWGFWGGVGGKAELAEISRPHKRAMQEAAGGQKGHKMMVTSTSSTTPAVSYAPSACYKRKTERARVAPDVLLMAG